MGSCATCASRWMRTISRNVSATLSSPPARTKRIRELCFGTGYGELKDSAARLVRLRRQLATMSIDDEAANRQPHAGSTGFRGVEGIEDPIEMRRINAGTGIAHGHADACLVLFGADQQLCGAFFNRTHCL